LVHLNENEVAKAVASSDPATRENIFFKLKNLGNFKHNVDILKKRQDNIIVARRPNQGPVVAQNYLPCVSCFGFYQACELWRHEKKCPLRVANVSKSNSVTAEAKVLLRSAVSSDPTEGDGEMLLDMLNTRQDNVRSGIVNDKLIVKFGQVLHGKFCTINRIGDEWLSTVKFYLEGHARTWYDALNDTVKTSADDFNIDFTNISMETMAYRQAFQLCQ